MFGLRIFFSFILFDFYSYFIFFLFFSILIWILVSTLFFRLSYLIISTRYKFCSIFTRLRFSYSLLNFYSHQFDLFQHCRFYASTLYLFNSSACYKQTSMLM